MAFEKTLFFLLLMLFPKALESKTPKKPRVLGVSNDYDSEKGPKEEMREKIDTIKALLDEVSALAEICEEIKPCDLGACLNGGSCTYEAGGKFSCQCTIGWTGDRCQNVGAVGEIQDSTIVGNNETHLTKLSEWLEPVMQSDHHWKLCWRATRDGWGTSTFHSNCDNKGPTVTIIKADQYIFGGYTSVSWDGNIEYQSDSKAFLFSLVNKPGLDPLKLPQPGEVDTSYSHSTYSWSGYGPTFGRGHDIYIADQASCNAHSNTSPGYSYSAPPGHSYNTQSTNSFLTGANSFAFTPNEVETYYESK